MFYLKYHKKEEELSFTMIPRIRLMVPRLPIGVTMKFSDAYG